MIVNKKATVHIGAPTVENIIRALEDAQIPDNAYATEIDTTWDEIMSDVGFVRAIPFAVMVFEWTDDE